MQYVLQFYKAYQAYTPNAGKSFFTRPKWFDLLMGTSQVRLDILQGKTEQQIRSVWKEDLEKYKTMRKKYLLYTDYPEK